MSIKTYLIAAQNQVEQKPHPQDLGATSITIGGIILISSLVATAFAAIQNIVNLTSKANAAKADLDRMDILINNKLDAIGQRIDAGFQRIDKEYLRMDRRISLLSGKCQSIEMYLSKSGYATRQTTDDDSV